MSYANQFVWKREAPVAVQMVRLGFPLVHLGGEQQLTEAWFDHHWALAGPLGGTLTTYALAMSGGEPYATWR